MKRTLLFSALFALGSCGFSQDKLELVSNAEAMDHVIEVHPARYRANGAETARIMGTVVVLATVGIDGKIVESRVVSGHPLLVDGAMLAVRSWRFSPFERGGKPTKVNVKVEVGVPWGYNCDYRNEYYSQVNRCIQFARGRDFSGAEKSCKRAVSLATEMERLSSGQHMKNLAIFERGRSLALLGQVYNGAGRYVEAEKSLEAAINVSQKLSEPNVGLKSAIERELAVAKGKGQQ